MAVKRFIVRLMKSIIGGIGRLTYFLETARYGYRGFLQPTKNRNNI